MITLEETRGGGKFYLVIRKGYTQRLVYCCMTLSFSFGNMHQSIRTKKFVQLKLLTKKISLYPPQTEMWFLKFLNKLNVKFQEEYQAAVNTIIKESHEKWRNESHDHTSESPRNQTWVFCTRLSVSETSAMNDEEPWGSQRPQPAYWYALVL